MDRFKVNCTQQLEAIHLCAFCRQFWAATLLTRCYTCGEIFCPKCVPKAQKKLVAFIAPNCKSAGRRVGGEHLEYNHYCSDKCFSDCPVLSLRH